MRFIEALKLRSKLFFLFVLITLALVFVGVVGASYINAMKRNMDSLYFGSLVPVTELNEIVHTYRNGISDSVHKVSRKEISPLQATQNIEQSLKYINKKWKSYSLHFKRDEEVAYVDYVDL
ncbi:MAG: MCP four helix bundle domain-containing protein [Sulfurimonas sp.]